MSELDHELLMAAEDWALTDEQRVTLRAAVLANIDQLRQGDEAYWRGMARAVGSYAGWAAERISQGHEPGDVLNFYEAMADRALAGRS